MLGLRHHRYADLMAACMLLIVAETLECHAAMTTNPPTLIELAPQQLVNCAANPRHCGGTGGCEGSIVGFGYFVYLN